MRKSTVSFGLGLAVCLAWFASSRYSPTASAQGCDAQATPIRCENQLPGNDRTEWDLAGASDATIQGFATTISVNKGDPVSFKIATDAPSYHIDIYRLGFYAGLGARRVDVLPAQTGVIQPECLKDDATGLIDCGNWSESASWVVPTSAVSGIYVAKLVRDDTAGASHIVFVVRDDARQSDLVFQTSDTTWQAYNTYGGNSLYVGGPGISPGRAYKVSYNRPFVTRETNPTEWLFNAEYPMLRWLEANGYDMSYMAGSDTDRMGASGVTGHRVFLSTGADQYWTAEQRQSVEAARSVGVHLAFFSGAAMLWKARWEGSIDGLDTPYRTLVSYRESLAGAKIDPSPIWTGSWRDARFSPPADGGLSENAVTGTLFGVQCCTAATAISVPQAVAAQPFWRNTRIAALSPGATTQLAAGSLGPIWDEVPSNPDQPAGVSQLSLTTLTVAERLLDEGATFGPATATHALALHRDPSGAWVFSAGTAQWSWGLDGTHDGGGSAPDVAMQQATVNLLFDMGALPRSLQPGLLPGDADTTPPTVSISGPTAGTAVAGTIAVTGNAADNVSVASVRFIVDGATIGTSSTAPYSVTWNTTAIGNGSHTLTATALDPSGNIGASAPVVITVANPVAPAVDVVAFGDRSTASSTLASSAFSTTAGNALLLAFISADDTATGQTVSSISGGSLTWTLVRRTNVRRGDSEIWRAFATSTLSNVTVTATLSQSAAASITVVSFKGVDTSGTNGSGAIGATQSSSSAAGAPTGTLTTTRAASLVFGVGNDWDRATGRTVGSNQTLVHQYLATVGDSFWVQRVNSASSASGVGITINDSAPTGDQYNLTLCEILPSSPDVTAPVVSVSAPAPGATVSGNSVTVTATGSDNVGIAGIQFLLDGTALGTEDTTSPYSISWNTTTASSGSHTLRARARDAAGNVTTSSAVTVTVSNDSTAPTVNMTAPAAGASVSGTSVTIAAAATDDVGVVGVQFLLDGVAVGAEDTTAPYSTSWNTTTATNGNHTLAARARDAAGNTTTSASVTVAVSNDTTAPSVSVTAPAPGASISGSITVDATASDNVGVVGVQFLLDGAALGAEDTTSPYSTVWNSATAGDGSHTLSARARDAAGNTTTSGGVTVTVNNDSTAPTVSVTAPSAGATVSGTAVTVSATASDNVGVLGVQFLLDGVALSTEDTTSPYSRTWNTTTASNGSHTLTARARDAAGNTTTSAGVTVTVNNDATAPAVSMTAPSAGATVSGTAVAVSATASDNVGVVGVQFLIDGATLGTEDTTSPYSTTWNTTTASNGTHTLTARARDAAGNTTTSAGVTVTVNNDATAPTVSVTSPTAGATVSGSAVAVSATASDNVGVVGVQFLLDGAALGPEDTTSPYATTWNTTTASNSSHTLTARARDGAGNTTTSAGVTVTVNNDTTAPTVSVSAPSAGATVSGTAVMVSASASDNVGVVGVQFLLDGAGLGSEDTAAPYSITWNSTTATNGSHSLSARARDAAGNMTVATAIPVTVQNNGTAPTVAVTSPTNGATVSSTIAASATASSGIGIAGVRFNIDGVPIGVEDTAAPFTATFTAPAGSHVITATARDNAGLTNTSSGVTVTVGSPTGTALTVNGSQMFQVMDGVGVNINSLSWKGGELRPALDMLIDQMGTNLWRVVFDMEDWEDPNDNTDPTVANQTYYNAIYSNAKFQNLWGTLHYLNGRGFTSGVAVSFMGRVPPWMGGNAINSTSEDEWVEMMVSFVAYARGVEGVQFDILDPINEPDWDGIEGPQVNATQYTRLLRKLALRLDALGLNDIRFLGPNTASSSGGVSSFIPTLMSDSVVISKLDHFGLHDYGGNTSGADSAIKSSQYPTRNFWMTEFSRPADISSLIAQNSSGLIMWDGYDSVYNHAILAGRGTIAPNDAGNEAAPLAYNSSNGTYSPRSEFYQFAAWFKNLPRGSKRIGTTYSNGNLSLFAFVHQPTGRLTFVGRNTSSTAIQVVATLNGVPTPSVMQVYSSTSSSLLRGNDAAVTNGKLVVTIPGSSYFSVTGVGLADTTPPTVSMSAPADGATVSGTIQANATATDGSGIQSVQLVLDGAPAGPIDATSPYSFSWDTTSAANGTHSLAAIAVDAAGNTTTSTAISVMVNNTPDTTPPSVSVTSPLNGSTINGVVTLAAAAADDKAVVGVQFAVDGVNIGAEVAAAPYSLTWDSATASNGTHTLRATARDAAGNSSIATVSVTVSNAAPAFAIDSTASGDSSSAVSSISATGLTTHASGQLLLAFVSADDRTAGNTVSAVTGVGLAWQLVVRTNARRGVSEIWRTVAPSPLTNATITATLVQSAAASVTVVAFTGADVSGTNGSGGIGATKSASAASGAPTVSLTTTRANSWVFAVGNDWDGAQARTLGTNQTMIHQYLATVGDTFWVQRTSAPTAASGTIVTINDTAPTTHQYNLSACEVLPKP